MPYGKLPTLQWPLSLLGHVQRYFRRNEGSTDYATIPEVTLAGDFVIEFDLLPSDDSDDNWFLSGAGNANLLGYRASSNALLIRISNGSFIGVGSGEVARNKINKIRIERQGSTAKVRINNTDQPLLTGISEDVSTFNRIYSAQSQLQPFTGILASLKIYDNGTLARDYPLDDNSDILANRATSLGQELVTNGDFSDGLNGWLQTGSAWQEASGSAEKTNGSSFLYQTNVADVGSSVLVSFDIKEISGGSLAVSLSDGGTTASFDSVGRKSFVGELTKNKSVYFSGGNSALIAIDNISIRQADGYGTIINGNASDWGLFDKQANGDWLGQELVVNDLIQSIDIGGPAITSYTTNVDPKVGLEYNIGVDIQNYSGTNTVGFSASTNGITSDPRLSSEGRITYSFIAEGTAGINLFSRSTNQCTFNNISVKEVLKNA